MSPRHLLTATAIALLTLATASAHAQTTTQNGGRLRALIAQRQAAAAEAVLPAGVLRIADVPYGADPAQRMDVYVPTSPNTGTNSLVASAVRAPVIFMVHGGGWRYGDKAMGRVVQEKVSRWVPKGFIFISINYRMLQPWCCTGQWDNAGFQVISNVVDWCRTHGIYVILDMHAAPGHPGLARQVERRIGRRLGPADIGMLVALAIKVGERGLGSLPTMRPEEVQRSDLGKALL